MNPRRHTAALSAALVVVIGSSGLAAADPPDPTTPPQSRVDAARDAVAKAARQQRDAEKRIQAAQSALDSVNATAELASEKYNKSRAVLARRVAAAASARAEADAARQAAGAAQSDLDHLAASVYMQGGSFEGLEALLGTAGFGDLARNAADVESVGSFRQRTLSDARSSAARAEATRRAAAAAQVQQAAAAAGAQQDFVAAGAAVKRAATQAAKLAAERAAIVAQLAALRRTSIAVETARAQGLAQAAAARDAQARAAAARKAADQVPSAALPAADSRAAATAIAYAKAQIGKPYVWAAEGPHSFDCSGLTMQAWRAAGVGLTHYTGWQWDQTARVPIDRLQPGDLVFFGADVPSIHHVGLYVGNGQMIEAPYTGEVVRYSTIYRSGLLPYGGRATR